jgi:hypothetical protein
MHGVRREPRRERIRPHHLGRDGDGNAFIGEPAQRVLGREQAANAALGIGERRGDGVPAVEDDLIARLAPRAPIAAARRAAARFWPRLPFPFAHARFLSRRRRSGNFSR